MAKNKPLQLTPEQRELLAVKVASLIAQLNTDDEIATKLGISKRQAQNLRRSETCQKALQELQESVKAKARTYIARQGNKLLPKAVAALERALDEKADVQGVKLVLKTYGVIDSEDDKQTDTNITVVMPSTDVKDVDSEVEE